MIRNRLLVLCFILLFFSCTKPDSDSDSVKDADMVCDDTPNTLQNILDDMSLSNEGHPNGINHSWSWYSGPDVKNPAPIPENFLNGWGLIFREENSALSSNTRIQIKYVKTYYLTKSDNLWHQVQDGLNLESKWYLEYISNDNDGISSNQRSESIGISGNPISGYCFHFWDIHRGPINSTDIKGTFVTIAARLIVDNPNFLDDRTSSRFLVNAGADYYLDMNNGSPTNIGEGRFKYVKTGWRCFNFCSLSQTEIQNNPPPLN